MSIVPFYDRSELIDRVLATLRKTLLVEILLVTLAHVVFLLHFRSILIVTLPLPLAVLLSFLAMPSAGVTSNLMSLAGIAIAIGVLVDAGIVVTENAFREIERRGIDPADRRARLRGGAQSLRLVGAARLLLDDHHPARVRAGVRADGAGRQAVPSAGVHEDFAVLAATVMAVTLVPVLCTLLLRGRMHGEERQSRDADVHRLYRPVLEARCAIRPVAAAAGAALRRVASSSPRGSGPSSCRR